MCIDPNYKFYTHSFSNINGTWTDHFHILCLINSTLRYILNKYLVCYIVCSLVNSLGCIYKYRLIMLINNCSLNIVGMSIYFPGSVCNFPLNKQCNSIGFSLANNHLRKLNSCIFNGNYLNNTCNRICSTYSCTGFF